VEKEYVVRVNKGITDEFLQHMREGVIIMGKKTRPAKVLPDKKNADQFYITLTEGKNRQIRRMCYKLGYEVEKLKRIRILDVELGKLLPGKWEEFRIGS
jgi:23S rRNA pseudouridine2604 synthase